MRLLMYIPGRRGGVVYIRQRGLARSGPGSCAFLYIYSAPLGVVVGHAAQRRLEGLSASPGGESMQYPASEFRRILLPRRWVNRGKKDGRAIEPGLNRPGHSGKSGEPPDQEHSRDHKQGTNQEDPDRRHVGKRLVPSAPHSRERQRRNQRPEQTAEDTHHDEDDIPLRSSHAAASSSSLPRIH